MLLTTYNLNTAARERLANWVYNNYKSREAADMTDDVLLEIAKHAAGACAVDCVHCCPRSISHSCPPNWALDLANNSAGNLEDFGHVELSGYEAYSGHAEVILFVEADYDVIDADDGEPDGEHDL